MASGSIVKRNGTYSVRYRGGINPINGRPIEHRKQFDLRRDAEKFLRSKLREIDTGQHIEPANISLADYLREWLVNDCVRDVRITTLEEYSKLIESHLIPTLGSIQLSQLTPDHLRKYYADKLKNGKLRGKGGLAAPTVRHHYAVLHKSLDLAVNRGLIMRNVADMVSPPRVTHKEMHVLDPQGIKDVQEAAKTSEYRDLYNFAIYTGLRRSELCGLRLGDIDLDLATVHIVQARHILDDGTAYIDEPKSRRGRRSVALAPTAVLGIRSYLERRELIFEKLEAPEAAHDPSRYLFCDEAGEGLRPDNVSKSWERVAARAGHGQVRFHDLRHTFASIMLAAGVNPKIVADALGHASVSFTLDTYSHVIPGLQAEAVAKFESYLAAV